MGRTTVFGNLNDSYLQTMGPGPSIVYGDYGGSWNGIMSVFPLEQSIDAYLVIKTNVDSRLGTPAQNFEYSNSASNNAVYVTIEGSDDVRFNTDPWNGLPLSVMTLYQNSTLATIPQGNSTVANTRLIDSIWHIPNFVIPTRWWRVGFGVTNTVTAVANVAVSIDLAWTER